MWTVDGPQDITADGKFWYVTDDYTSRILLFPIGAGIAKSIGHIGNGDGEFLHPAGAEIFDGKLVVLDNLNNRVQVLSLDGILFSSFPLPPSLAQPLKYCLSRQGHLFINDPTSGFLVTEYDLHGHRLKSFGKLKREVGHTSLRDLNDAEVGTNSAWLSVDDDENIYAAFLARPTVHRYSADGKLQYQIELAGEGADDLAAASLGRVTAAQFTHMHVRSAAVTLVTLDIAVDQARSTGYVLGGNNRVYRFDLRSGQDRNSLKIEAPLLRNGSSPKMLKFKVARGRGYFLPLYSSGVYTSLLP
ncbi:MAG TPA: hypothetical protein VGN16_11045 [Acidobacteriaceae bacterium]|jgi:hypothetical protein